MLRFFKEILKFFVVLLAIKNCLCLKFKFNFINITEMSTYLQHFNNEVFTNNTSQLTVIKSVRTKRAKYFLNDLLDEYSKNFNNIKLIVKEVNRSYKHFFDYMNVFFIDSYESFEKIDAGSITATEDFSEYYVIIFYSENGNPENEIQKIFNYCWHFYTVKVALLLKTNEEKPIKLYTYYPFTKESCKNAQMDILNQNKSILQLKASEIFPNKFKKFYNCIIQAALWNVAPYLKLPETGSLTKRMTGIEGYLLNVLSRILEFKVDYAIPPNNEQRGLIKTNGQVTGALKMLKDRSADLSLGSFRCTLERSTLLSPSMPFYQTMQVFTVLSLSQPWSNLEIIAYPFQFHIWIVLMFLILFLLSSTLTLKLYFPNSLKFLYGFSSIYFIYSNTIAITLSQAALFVPKRNFARYILMMWILLTMILRSLYQGALYDFLTTQENLAPPDSVADLIKRRYKLIVNVATNDSFSGVPILRDKLIEVLIMNISDAGGFPLLEENPDKRYVTGTPKDFLTYYVNTHGKNGVFHVLKETVFAQHLCIYFPKHSYLIDTFDRVLQNLRNFGLIDYWASQFVNDQFLESVNVASTKTSLTFTQLSGIVEICLVLYLLTIIVFLCEIFWFKYKSN